MYGKYFYGAFVDSPWSHTTFVVWKRKKEKHLYSTEETHLEQHEGQ